MLLWPLDSPLTGCTILSSVPSTWRKARAEKKEEEIMTTTVSLSVAALTIDCADPAALADFWGKALGRPG